MKITSKSFVFLFIYSASLLGAGVWLSHLFSSEEKELDTPVVAQNTLTAEAPVVKPDENPRLSGWFASAFESDTKKESATEFLEAYVAGEDADYGSWEFRQKLKELALSDWGAASKFVEAIPSERNRISVLQSILPRLANEDPELAIRIANQTSNKTARNKILGEICDHIAPNNPEYVASLFLQNGYKNVGDYEIRNFVADYAREDLVGAREFTDNIKDPVIWKSAMTQYLYKWSEKDPEKAADFAVSHKASLHGASSMLGQLQAKKNAQTTVDYGMSMAVNESSIEFLDGAYMRWAYDDVHSAAESILDVPTERLKFSSYRRVAEKFADVEPQKGQEWIEKLTSEQHKKVATYRFVETWSANNPTAAVEYVNDLSSGKVKDSGIRALVKRFQDVEPAYALEWTQAISAESSRNKWIEDSYRKWSIQDAQAAQSWLSTADELSPSMRDKLSK